MKKKLPILIIILVLILTGGMVYFLLPRKQLQPPANQPPVPTARISITKDGFSPATLSIKKGTKVIWTNNDENPHRVASNPHPNHTDLSGLDSKDLPLGPASSYSYTFEKSGTYSYHDHFNPTLNGSIQVTE